MRVLHLFDFYLPATLSWVSRLLMHLPEAAIEIGAPWIVRNQFYRPEFRYHRFPLQMPGLFDPVSESQFPVWKRVLTRSQRFLPTYPYWLERQLRHQPPDILHAHFGPTGCLYLPVAKKLDRPLVVTFYGFDYRKLLHHRPVFKKKYQELFDGAARVVAASPIWGEQLAAMGCPTEKIAFVRPSPDLAQFPFVQRSKPPGRLNLVQVATITPKKGHLVTLEALRLARTACPDLHLTMVGEQYDRTLTKQIRAFIQQHGLESCVTWTGPIDHSAMATFMAQFDAFVHPSQRTADGDHEAVSVVLLEAQAVGLPVLSTRHYDIPDQVQHGCTGCLVPEGDVLALADAMRTYYCMEDKSYQTLCQNAHLFVNRTFDVRTSAQNLRTLYAKISRGT